MKPIMRSLLSKLATATVMLSLVACETVQTTQGGAVGVTREQRMAVPAAEIQQAASQEYAQVMNEARSKGLLNRNSTQVQRVRNIVNRLIPQTAVFRPDALQWAWEANVLTSPEVNAWAMPGGKIAVYTGLIDKLNVTDDELAAVLGHEISHALREHSRERASEQMVAGSLIQIGSELLGLGDIGQKGAEYAYMGLVGLPHSRNQESEADRMGVELAARAGYDPRAAISLWQKMGQIGGAEPIKFLSTHPSREDRLNDLTNYSQRVMPLYEQARKK
ncbi:M48 family metallopeptidase [Noviherbaspirillum sp. UKPF54]|uniref:M48 family metallopeptidase n=1 Tax=Noviherbaspirillum sp. UKPF54 TaxID=2601898 RepID=UPI0011B11E64|nr:M48 family metallopeptidase [Noviherbaspirillum sp. UKPF54]QDZ28301.1 M48 family metallopeptidase [Noviherbaspirillum sp. UKPF54]